MSLEAMKKIADAEQKYQSDIAALQLEAKRLLAEAENNGRELLESARLNSERVLSKAVSDAEMEARAASEALLQDNEKECAELRLKAGKLLDEAAEFIAGRIVG